MLCGGKNSRIQKYDKKIVKPLIKFGGRTILEHNLDLISKIKDIDKVYINVSKNIRKFQKLKKKNKFTIIKEKKIQGTAGVLFQNIKKFNNDILIVYADNYLIIDIKKFYEFFKKEKIQFLIGVFYKKDLSKSGLVKISKKNKVLKLEEKKATNKHVSGLCNAGIYLLRKSCVLKFVKKSNFSDFSKDIIPHLIKKNLVYSKRIKTCFSFDEKTDYLKNIRKLKKFLHDRKSKVRHAIC
jgi:NDP-sugar pyrophosphorylase family protein